MSRAPAPPAAAAGSPPGSAPHWAPYVLAVAVIAALVLAMAALAAGREQQRASERAALVTQNTARLLSQHVGDVLDKVDIALRATVNTYLDQLERGSLNPQAVDEMLARRETLFGVQGIRILDAAGIVRHGTGVHVTPPVSLADRDFYLRARDHPEGGVITAGPLQARIAKQWVLVLARRITLRDGSFGGVVYANITTGSFEHALAIADLGPHGAATLRAADLALIHRFPDNKGAQGSKQVSKQLSDSMARHPEQGVYLAPTALDGIERSNAYRRLDHYPVYVIVGLATSDFLGERAGYATALYGLAALTVAVAAAAGLLLFRAQQRLAASMAEWRDLYDHAPCGYHSVNAQGLIVQMNATALAWLGCTRDEVIGRRYIWEFLTGEGRSRFEQYFPRFLADGHAEDLAFDLRSRDGQVRQVNVNANAVRDHAGRFLMSRSVMFDMTDVRRLEAQARQLLGEQAVMLDNDLIAIFRLRDRRVVWANKAATRIFGHPLTALLNQSTRVLFPDDETFLRLGEQAYAQLAQGVRYRQQLAMRRQDGSTVWIDLSGENIPGSPESMWMLADITELRQSQQLLEHQALHDALTGLPNRRLLDDRLQQALGAANRTQRMVALCFLDLDDFKPVNDLHGHAAGDLLLIEVARRLLACVRPNDTVCRMGGDEFVLLMTNLASELEAEVIVARAADQVQQPFTIPGVQTSIRLSFSAGLALYPEDAQDAGRLLNRADDGMYKAKAHGKNQRLRVGKPA